jgi:hypothetical protein
MSNNLTYTLSHVCISCICVTCVTLYKYINNNNELAGYTRGYTGVTQCNRGAL